MRLLVVENDEALGNRLRKELEAEQYSVDVAGDGTAAEALTAAHAYDLLILDLKLRVRGGMEVLRHLRARPAPFPILVLADKSCANEQVQALDEGADDFLVMPCSLSELSARVRALLRRGRGASPVLRADDLEMDRLARVVRRGGRRIELTPKEYGVLEILMMHAGQRVTRPMILEGVWNFSGVLLTNIVDVYINYLRKKIDAEGKRLIQTVRGVGYELKADRIVRAAESPAESEWAGTSNR